ncbi:c-type cytochrome [Lutimonas sp.]|jgi:hypothetical protein|uniref:c-type cytochrome n=1 Tax=Lutimonas sp. TaxID=1872403 RepID=UPI003C727C67
MKYSIYLILMALLFLSCADKKDTPQEGAEAQSKNMSPEYSEAYQLLKNQCYACHSPISSSHDVIIAPPMAAVKLRYSRSYTTKEEFVEAMVSWAMNPNKEKALMRGAVDRFQQMPKQAFVEEDLRKIAAYVYENELEEPEWFAAHEKEMHAKGGGMGQGMP